MKTVYVGFSIDKEKQVVYIAAFNENKEKAVQSVLERFPTLPYLVCDLATKNYFSNEVVPWLQRHGVPDAEIKNCLQGFRDQIVDLMKRRADYTNDTEDPVGPFSD